MWSIILAALQGFSYFGLGLGGCVACVTFLRVSERTVENQWNENFKNSFTYFWDSAILAEARHMVDFSGEYERLKPVLIKVNSGLFHEYSRDELKAIESIDRFCATLSIIDFYKSRSKKMRSMYNQVFLDSWIKQISKRPELIAYIEKHWTNIFILVKEMERQARKASSVRAISTPVG